MLRNNQVHVWKKHFRCSHKEVAELRKLLSEDERKKANRNVVDAPRNNFVCIRCTDVFLLCANQTMGTQNTSNKFVESVADQIRARFSTQRCERS